MGLIFLLVAPLPLSRARPLSGVFIVEGEMERGKQMMQGG
jgi:hypothetical protein